VTITGAVSGFTVIGASDFIARGPVILLNMGDIYILSLSVLREIYVLNYYVGISVLGPEITK
jgi:hypothetical protein